MKIAKDVKLYISVTCAIKGLWTIGLQWSTICSSRVRYVERSIGIAPAFHVTELNIELIRNNLAWTSRVQKVDVEPRTSCWDIFTNTQLSFTWLRKRVSNSNNDLNRFNYTFLEINKCIVLFQEIKVHFLNCRLSKWMHPFYWLCHTTTL